MRGANGIPSEADSSPNGLDAKEGLSEQGRYSIVMLTCQYTEILGGAERQCARLTEALRAADTNIIVLTSKVPGFRTPCHEPGVIRFWTFAPPQLAGRYIPASLIWAIQAFCWIARNRHEIDVLHCHQLRINAYVAALANALWKIPTLMKPGVGGVKNDFHVISRRKYLLGKRGAEFVARHTTTALAISSEIAADCQAAGVPSGRIKRIPNGVDLTSVEPRDEEASDERLRSLYTERQFLFAGRLSAEKNLIALAEAASCIETETRTVLTFLGDGPLFKELRAIGERSAVVEIRCPGSVATILPHLARCHFSLIVSEDEGLSNFLLEAACAGTVPIISRASGNRDAVPFEDYPFVLTDPTIENVRDALERAIALPPDQWRHWSEEISGRARVEYSIGNVVKQYRALYGEMASRRNLRGVSN